MGKSAKASARVISAGRDSTAASQESRTATRGKAIGSAAVDNVARRQLQKIPIIALAGLAWPPPRASGAAGRGPA